jgi:uncharacterized protein (TIGR03435 family)
MIQPVTMAGIKPLCLAFAVALAATTAWGQASAPASQGPRAKKAAFDVVSVRSAKPGCSLLMAGPVHGRYTGRCVTLWALIYNTYKVRSFQDYPPGLPSWADKDKFDIEAKADDDTTAAMEKLSMPEQANLGREMLQSLLADRFRLGVHYESKVQPIYELVLAKGGFKLKPLPADQKPGGMSGRPGEMILHGKSIADLAHWLSISNPAGRTVVDKTGVTGNYDIDLKWTPDDQQGTPDAGPTLFTAIEEQLGLKLEPAKGPVDTLVIDHVEKPSEN